MWPIEYIPNEDKLHCRVHKAFLKNNDESPSASAFKNTPEDGDNLSTDWSKYSTPEQCREIVSKMIHAKTMLPKRPDDYFVYSFGVEAIRRILPIKPGVLHDPIFNHPEVINQPNNRAHSIIRTSREGNDNYFRLELVRIGEWSIKRSEL